MKSLTVQDPNAVESDEERDTLTNFAPSRSRPLSMHDLGEILTTQRPLGPQVEQDPEWAGCCSKSNRSFVKYITQICFGSSVMIFSMVQIARGVDNQEIYFSLLSGTLGLFLPHPEMKK